MLSSSRNKSGRFVMASVVDIIQRVLVVSVVFFMVSVVARKHLFYGFRSCGSKRGPRRAEGGVIPVCPPNKNHDCAGDAQARSE